MENKNIIIVGGFLMAIVAIYGIIGAIVRYKHARSKKEAIDVAKENLIITKLLYNCLLYR